MDICNISEQETADTISQSITAEVEMGSEAISILFLKHMPCHPFCQVANSFASSANLSNMSGLPDMMPSGSIPAVASAEGQGDAPTGSGKGRRRKGQGQDGDGEKTEKTEKTRREAKSFSSHYMSHHFFKRFMLHTFSKIQS